MRAVFGVVSILVALAVVAFVARTRLRHEAPAGTVAASASAPAPTVAGEARAVQEKARTDVERALQEGARRTEDADR